MTKKKKKEETHPIDKNRNKVLLSLEPSKIWPPHEKELPIIPSLLEWDWQQWYWSMCECYHSTKQCQPVIEKIKKKTMKNINLLLQNKMWNALSFVIFCKGHKNIPNNIKGCSFLPTMGCSSLPHHLCSKRVQMQFFWNLTISPEKNWKYCDTIIPF